MKKRIIFHLPLPLNYEAKSASGIRPVQMLKSFEEMGYIVDLVTGYGKERKLCIKKIKSNIQNGHIYDFVYSESSTMPTALTEKNHVPKYPFLDFSFFKYCKKHNIPIGLFYRDIYWLFPEYGQNVSFIKKHIAKLFYRIDLFFYRRLLTKLYLPSLTMGDYIPKRFSSIIDELPPGFQKAELSLKKNKCNIINILYIGGLGSLYEMQELFKSINDFNNITLTICTRKDEWELSKESYAEYMSDNINIVHKSGLELIELYEKATLTSLFIKPNEYRSFAAPVKLYEYLGYRKPIITTSNTKASDFILKNNIGWSIPYSSETLINLLHNLMENPQVISKMEKNMDAIRDQHSWPARTRKVQEQLGSNK